MRLKKLLLLFFFIGCSTFLLGQQKTLLDSSFQYLNDKYYEFKNTDSINAKFYADLYYQKAFKEKDTIEMTGAYLFKSEVLKNDSIYLNFLDQIISITKDNPTKEFPAYAFQEKGVFYILKRENDRSLHNYLQVLKYTKKVKNDSLKYIAKQRIGIIKMRNKEYNEAIKLYLDYYNFRKGNLQDNENYAYTSVLVNITNAYIKLKKYDSASHYCSEAYKYSIKFKNNISTYATVFRQGQIELNKMNFQVSIDSISKAIPSLIIDENYIHLSEAYQNIGQAYFHLKDTSNTIYHYNLVDSLYQQTKIPHISQKQAYSFMFDFYKKNNDLKNQLKYIEKLLNIDSILNSRNRKLDRTLFEEYDKPKLISEKQRIIDELEGNLSRADIAKYSLLGTSGIILLLLGYQYQRRKQLKRRFEEVVKSNGNRETRNKKQETRQVELNIPEEVIEKVLKGLEVFEAKYQFCDAGLNLQSLASHLETNANYLSKIINHYKELSFSQYLNELRINHVITLLDTNTTLRKYSIKAIAQEVGYKNAESFSNAFYKKTGLKPSYYIKQLEKVEV